MKRLLKEFYGVGILFFYFFKWPYFFGFIYLYNHGLNNNYILIILWFYCIALIIKDIYWMIKNKKISRCNHKPQIDITKPKPEN